MIEEPTDIVINTGSISGDMRSAIAIRRVICPRPMPFVATNSTLLRLTPILRQPGEIARRCNYAFQRSQHPSRLHCLTTSRYRQFEVFVEFPHSSADRFPGELSLHQAPARTGLSNEFLRRLHESVHQFSRLFWMGIDRAFFEQLSNERSRYRYRSAGHGLRHAYAESLHPSSAVEEDIEIELTEELRYSVIQKWQNAPVRAHPRLDLVRNATENSDFDVRGIRIGATYFASRVWPFEPVRAGMSADDCATPGRRCASLRPFVHVDQVEEIALKERWLVTDELFELCCGLSDHWSENDRSTEHALQVSFHHRKVVLRHPVAVERWMLNHANDALRAHPDRCRRHSLKDETGDVQARGRIRPFPRRSANAMFDFLTVSAVRLSKRRLRMLCTPTNGIRALVRPNRLAASISI